MSNSAGIHLGIVPTNRHMKPIEQCRINCLKYSWVIDIDIKGYFDNIDHELLMKAFRHYTDRKQILLYCKRWLEVPVQLPDGTHKYPEGKGTPQGGVISPVLANIFLDIVFDKWIEKNFPDIPFESYADDVVVHCRNIKQALRLLEVIKQRFKDCKLELTRRSRKSFIVAETRRANHHSKYIIRSSTFWVSPSNHVP